MERKESSATAVSLLMRFGLASIVLLATFGALAAQEGSEKEPPPAWRNPDKSKSLDDLRKLNELVGFFEMGMGMGRDEQRPPKPPIQVLKEEQKTRRMKIDQLGEELRDPKADRAWVEEQLASDLASYFITDLKCRVMELDEIKAKLAQTEAKLQKRLSAKVETVDLQLQIMLREADGLGFFSSPDGADAPSAGEDLHGASMSMGEFDSAMGEKIPVAATLRALTEILSTTQTLTLVVDDSYWYHYRLPDSFDDEAAEGLAGAILKTIGSETGPGSLLWERVSATLHVGLTSNRYMEFGKNIPNVIEVLKKSADTRQQKKAETVTAELLER